MSSDLNISSVIFPDRWKFELFYIFSQCPIYSRLQLCGNNSQQNVSSITKILTNPRLVLHKNPYKMCRVRWVTIMFILYKLFVHDCRVTLAILESSNIFLRVNHLLFYIFLNYSQFSFYKIPQDLFASHHDIVFIFFFDCSVIFFQMFAVSKEIFLPFNNIAISCFSFENKDSYNPRHCLCICT